jgi:hypothetical protein
MNEVRTFEDLEAWQVGRQLAKAAYAITRQDNFNRAFGLRDQVQRAGLPCTVGAELGWLACWHGSADAPK